MTEYNYGCRPEPGGLPGFFSFITVLMALAIVAAKGAEQQRNESPVD